MGTNARRRMPCMIQSVAVRLEPTTQAAASKTPRKAGVSPPSSQPLPALRALDDEAARTRGYETAAARRSLASRGSSSATCAAGRAARIRARRPRAGPDRTDGRRQSRSGPAARRARLQPQSLWRSSASLRALEPATLQDCRKISHRSSTRTGAFIDNARPHLLPLNAPWRNTSTR